MKMYISLVVFCILLSQSTGLSAEELSSIRVTVLDKNGAHGHFSPDDKHIVIDRYNAKRGFYDLYLFDLDGNETRSLTANKAGASSRSNGWPVWHPSGEFIVFQREADTHFLAKEEYKQFTFPGYGFSCNLFAVKPDNEIFWRLTDVPIKKTIGDGIVLTAVVNPKFSHDGRRIFWTERYGRPEQQEKGKDWGKWRVKVADFVVKNGVPTLSNEKTLIDASTVDQHANYVNMMGIWPDNQSVLLAGNLTGQDEYEMDLYRYYIKSGKVQRLISTDFWEEGSALSPDGKTIVFSTNAGSPYKFDPNIPWEKQPRTKEWWIMNSDGSNRRALTRFNSPKSLEHKSISKGRAVITADCSFSHDGRKLVGILGVDRDGSKSNYKLMTVLVELNSRPYGKSDPTGE